jgi:hypothetical protein
MNETQIALEIGLMGRSKAVSFLQSLLSRFQGNVTQAASEAPIHGLPMASGMSADEDALTDEQAIRDWNAPSPKSSFDHAVNFIFTHPGCLSREVKQHVKKSAGITDNQWANILIKLGNDRRFRKEGERVHMRWYTV